MRDSLQITDTELREDIDVLNVVNFGGGSYVLYAEVPGDQIEVDPEPYGDNFAKPARLLPLEAKALVAAIDLLGDHLPGAGSLAPRARRSWTRWAGPGRRRAPDHHGQGRRLRGRARGVRRDRRAPPARDRVLQGERGRVHRPHASSRTSLLNGQEGWYVHACDLDKDEPRSFRLDRIKSVDASLDETFEPRPGVEPDVHGWPTTGEVRLVAPRARVDLARARPLGARGPPRGRRS